MIRRIPVVLSILFSLLGIPLSLHGDRASTEQMSLVLGACEVRVVSVDLRESLDNGKGKTRLHDGDHRLAVVHVKIPSVVEGALVLTPGGFSILLKAKERHVYRIGVSATPSGERPASSRTRRELF